MARRHRKSSGIICTARRVKISTRINTACHSNARSVSMALPNTSDPQFGPDYMGRNYRPCLLAGLFLDSNFPRERPCGVGRAGNFAPWAYIRSIGDGCTSNPANRTISDCPTQPSRLTFDQRPASPRPTSLNLLALDQPWRSLAAPTASILRDSDSRPFR